MFSTGLLVLKLRWKKDVDVVWAASTATGWGQGASVTKGLEAHVGTGTAAESHEVPFHSQ